jgi:hypothetical protein
MMSGTGHFQAYSAFVDHPRVREQLINEGELEDKASYERFARRVKFFSDIHPVSDDLLKHLLPKYNLGGCDLPNQYRLVLALRAEPLQMYVLPENLAQNLVLRQWWSHPDQPPAPPSEEELRRNGEAFRKLQAALNDPQSEIYRQLHRQWTNEELNALLDAQFQMVSQITDWLNDKPYQSPVPRNTNFTYYSE